MKKQKPTAHADGARHSRRGKEAQPHDAQSPEQKQERKDRVLTEGASSMVRDIGDAIVVKDQNIFFLTNPDGNVPLEGQHGLGLYYHDCRFVSGCEIPHTPYYGTIDATVLFLILLGRHAAWTGSLVLFNDLKPRLVQSGHVAATRLVLLAVPAAFAVRYVPAWKNEALLFIITGIAIIPLAGWMGRGRR